MRNKHESEQKAFKTVHFAFISKKNVKNTSFSLTYLTFRTFQKFGMPNALPYFSQPLVNMPLGLAHSHRQVGILQF